MIETDCSYPLVRADRSPPRRTRADRSPTPGTRAERSPTPGTRAKRPPTPGTRAGRFPTPSPRLPVQITSSVPTQLLPPKWISTHSGSHSGGPLVAITHCRFLGRHGHHLSTTMLLSLAIFLAAVPVGYGSQRSRSDGSQSSVDPLV